MLSSGRPFNLRSFVRVHWAHMKQQEVHSAFVRSCILMKWCEGIIGASHSVCSSPCTQVDTMLMSETFVINPTFRRQLEKHLYHIVSTKVRDLGSKSIFCNDIEKYV